MITRREAEDRGRANFGWLDSRHTFSFGQYFDPAHMGFSALRVINDDVVKPAAGFGTHSHQNMEIISYVLAGNIAHKDSEGHTEVLPAGEFQLMSAGSGIAHSEFNASESENLHFLQIWIEPDIQNTPPGYQQKNFGQSPGLTTVATPTGENGTLRIKQNASLHQLILKPGQSFYYAINTGRKVYLHQVNSELTVAGTVLEPGDGAKIIEESALQIMNASESETKTLVFDLP